MQIFYLLALLFLGVHVSAQLKSGAYDVATATKLYSYASFSYCSEAALRAWNCAGCDRSFGNVVVVSNVAQHNYIVDNNKDTIIIAFQGTSNVVAWVNNLKADLKPVNWCTGCQIHNGFYDIHMLVYNAIKSSVQQRLQRMPGAKVFVTGHSLGASIATLVSYNLVTSNTVQASAITVYTYGMPRSGNVAFSTAYDRLLPNSWRVVNHEDIVPHVPPAFLTDYRSTGTLVYCSVSASTNCQIRPGAEDDGSWTHFSVPDHLDYFGLLHSDFSSDTGAGCKASAYNPRFLQPKRLLRAKSIIQEMIKKSEAKTRQAKLAFPIVEQHDETTQK